MIVVATRWTRRRTRSASNRCADLARERGLPFFEISSVTGQGIDALKHAMAERVLSPLVVAE